MFPGSSWTTASVRLWYFLPEGSSKCLAKPLTSQFVPWNPPWVTVPQSTVHRWSTLGKILWHQLSQGYFVMWFRWNCGIWSKVGLDCLGGLLQPKWLRDPMAAAFPAPGHKPAPHSGRVFPSSVCLVTVLGNSGLQAEISHIFLYITLLQPEKSHSPGKKKGTGAAPLPPCSRL